MRIWLEIEYTNKEGKSIHSDLCLPIKDVPDYIDKLVKEIKEHSELVLPWKISSNGTCEVNHDH